MERKGKGRPKQGRVKPYTISIRVAPDLAAEVKEIAERDERSLNWEIEHALKLYVKSRTEES